MEPIRSGFFTCIGRQGHGAPVVPATREDWEQLRREPWLKQMCERIERGDEQLKHRLPVWTPHCAEFANNHRAIADAVKPLNRLMLDFDEKGHTDEILEKVHKENRPFCVLLVEESVRRGTHVLVELPDGMTPEEAQQLMKEATGFTPDAAVKDVARCIYMVPEDHTRYVSEKLFETVMGDTESTEKTEDTEGTVPQCSASSAQQGQSPCANKFPQVFKGIPYTSIISEWWRRTGGEPSEGERNKCNQRRVFPFLPALSFCLISSFRFRKMFF